MAPEILVATTNAGKLREFKQVLSDFTNVVSPAELSLEHKKVKEGSNYADNARLKAEIYADQYNGLICGEDSGLEIDALGGKPGPLSARYGGATTPHPKKCKMILDELKNVRMYDRTARFRANIALVDGKEVKIFEGILEGWIGFEYKGTEGFGYDPIFIPQGFSRTNAELGLVIKNQISHRGKAIRKLANYLKTEDQR